MLLILLAVVLLLGFGVVLYQYSASSAEGMTDQERKPWRFALMALGAFGFGILGLLAAIVSTLVIGFMLIGSRSIGNRASGEELSDLILIGGTLLFICAGAGLGYALERWIARRAAPTPAPDAR